MKFMRFLYVFAFLAASVQLAAHQGHSHGSKQESPSEVGTVKISGYIDSRLGFELEDSAFKPSVDSMAIYVDSRLSEWLSASVTLESHFDGRDFGIELDGAFLTASHDAHGTSISLGIGLFDIPFGIASFWYCSPDNLFAFAPGITDRIFDHGWIDFGLFGSLETEHFGLTAYMAQGAALDEDVFGAADKGLAGGLRVTVSPVHGITFGLSYALNAHYAGDKLSFVAGDVELELGPLSLIGQYTAIMPKFEFGDRLDTWFVQAMFDLKDLTHIPLSIGGRFDYFSEAFMADPTTGLGESANALTIQALYQLSESLRLSLSFRTTHEEESANIGAGGDHDHAHSSMVVLQALVTF